MLFINELTTFFYLKKLQKIIKWQKKKKKELTIPLFKFRKVIVRVSFRFNCFLSESSYSVR